MTEHKMIRLDQLFSKPEIEKAIAIYHECKEAVTPFHRRAVEEIVRPAMHRINQVTNQENDPCYWAYALEYAILRSTFYQVD